MSTQEDLVEYYSAKSKHSNYQVLPKILQLMLKDAPLSINTRYENERLDYLLKNINFKNKTILDIGGNTGFFIFELLSAGGVSAAELFEGNKEHADFVKLAAKATGFEDRIAITNEYFTFEGEGNYCANITLLLNVLHHVGDDYGDKGTTIEQARQMIISQLNSMRLRTDTVVFQLGYNWQGNPDFPLFENGTKKEVVEYIKAGTEGVWEISHIGIATRKDGTVVYEELKDSNIERDDSLGEFLNRPIFILNSIG